MVFLFLSEVLINLMVVSFIRGIAILTLVNTFQLKKKKIQEISATTCIEIEKKEIKSSITFNIQLNKYIYMICLCIVLPFE